MDASSEIKKIRVTQRTPRACLRCSKKKIKCDKKTPCSSCIKKGFTDTCTREVVLVANSIRNDPFAISLGHENAKLKSHIELQEKEIQFLKRQLESTNTTRISTERFSNNDVPDSKAKSPNINNLLNPVTNVEQYDLEIQYMSRGLSSESITGSDEPKQITLSDPYLNDSLDLPGSWDSKKRPSYLPSFTLYSTHWNTLENDANNLLPKISKASSRSLVDFSLRELLFLHGAVLPKVFSSQLDMYWDNHTHLNVFDFKYPDNDPQLKPLVRSRYAWFSLLYAILASSVLHCSTEFYEVSKIVSVSKLECGWVLLVSSLECLQRSEFFQFPSLTVLQAFCILIMCFHGYGDARDLYALLDFMIAVARRMGLDKLGDFRESLSKEDTELGKRIWWNLFAVDSFETYGRIPVIGIGSFKATTPAVFGSAIFTNIDNGGIFCYQHFINKLTSVRRMITGPSILFEKVLEADTRLKKLLQLLEKNCAENNILHKRGENYWFQTSLLFSLCYENITSVKKILSSFMSKDEWMKHHRDDCVRYSKLAITLLSQDRIPQFSKNYWFLPHGLITSASYLIVDILINVELEPYDERLLSVLQGINLLEAMTQIPPRVEKGLRMVRDIIGCITITNGDGSLKVAMKELDYGEIKEYALTEKLPDRFSMKSSYTDEYSNVRVNVSSSGSGIQNFIDLLDDNEWDKILNWLQNDRFWP